MKNVKEFLDKNFDYKEDSEIELRNNGHYGLFGIWGKEFSKGNKKELFNGDLTNVYRIYISCNNETIQIWAIAGGKKLKNQYYGYLQTYEHIPRGNPDKNGYYARSTEDEVIKYISTLYKELVELYNIYAGVV